MTRLLNDLHASGKGLHTSCVRVGILIRFYPAMESGSSYRLLVPANFTSSPRRTKISTLRLLLASSLGRPMLGIDDGSVLLHLLLLMRIAAHGYRTPGLVRLAEVVCGHDTATADFGQVCWDSLRVRQLLLLLLLLLILIAL